MNMHPAFFKHPEIMFSSLVRVQAHNSALPAYDQLYLLGMSLLFAGVILPLFFLGLSTGLSPTSTNTTEHFTVAFVSAFLPVNERLDSE
jgi:hypothetical protein